MKVRYTLSEEDITEIIANHFKVAEKDVNLKMTETYKGYGTNEHKDHIIECFIDLDEVSTKNY